jgi:hypothetical protein
MKMANGHDRPAFRHNYRPPANAVCISLPKPSIGYCLGKCGLRNSKRPQSTSDRRVQVREVNEPCNLLMAEAALLHPDSGMLGVDVMRHLQAPGSEALIMQTLTAKRYHIMW